MPDNLNLKGFILNLLFPEFCFGCQREGNYLCQDCIATLEISYRQYCLCQNPKLLPEATKKAKCSSCQSKKLDGLYFVFPYSNFLIKKVVQSFKYEPFVKGLASPLSSLIISHFQCLENPPGFIQSHFQLIEKPSFLSDLILIPVPLERKRLKWRGFNQAEEIAKELIKSLKIPLLCDILVKTKETLPQIELTDKEREENIKGCFKIENAEKIKGKKLLLIDDVYTTGATMEECARILKEAGALEVWGVAIARG